MEMHREGTTELPDQSLRSDRIFPATRWVAIGVIPFLLAAFVVLYFLPGRTGQLFAWEINPSMTALFIGAGYLGGAYFFARVATEDRWHRVAVGFPAVTVFTVAMLLATLVHLDRFNQGQLPFYVWFALYILTPVIIPAIWLRNRHTDPQIPEPDDATVPGVMRGLTALISVVMLVFAVLGLALPDVLASIWPWTLSALTGRVLGGWFAFLGVGGLLMAREPRWSAWRIGLQSIGLWQALILLGAALNPADFSQGPVNWYTIVVAVGLIAMIAGYVWVESRRRAPTRLASKASP